MLTPFIISIVSACLLFVQWRYITHPIAGIVLLLVYMGSVASMQSSVLARLLPVQGVWARFCGALTAIYTVAFSLGMPIVVWKYTHSGSLATLLLVAIASALLGYFFGARSIGVSHIDIRVFCARILHELKQKDVLLFGALAACFVFLVFHARTGTYILSPWAVLLPFSLVLFFGMVFLISKMIFAKRSITLVLGIIILFSYISHSYLPVVYETGFGGDKWRHLGAEEWLMDGNVYTPSIWGEETSLVPLIGPIAAPEALVAGNKTSYAAQWALTIFLAETLQVPLFWVDLLLVFVLWSFFLPLILFLFGLLILNNQRLGLLFAFLPTVFYTLQSEGAITLPVSLGHLFFFFVLLLWLWYVKEGNKRTLIGAIALSLFFYGGYILNFFVLIGAGFLAIIYRAWFGNGAPQAAHYKILFGAIAGVSVLAIPFLEIFQGLSSISSHGVGARSIIDACADAFGHLSGFIGSIVPPDFIDQGNFLYNQTKESLSRLPIFSYRIVPFVVSMAVWTIIAWGAYRIVKKTGARYFSNGPAGIAERRTFVFFGILLAIAFGSYFVSWSFTDGVHILARRLNETIAFGMAIFLGWGIMQFYHEKKIPIVQSKKILAIAFVIAFSATSTYASGPKLQLVTADEYNASRYIWEQHKNDGPNYCVIGNTWPLLGLEAASHKRIVAGNFPVYAEYAQPERVKIYEKLSQVPETEWVNKAFAVTRAHTCFYMNELRWMNDAAFKKTIQMYGEPKRIGGVYIWRIEQ